MSNFYLLYYWLDFLLEMHWEKYVNRAILCQLEKVVKNIYQEGGTFAGTLGYIPFLQKDN